jgi:hypothetical protein
MIIFNHVFDTKGPEKGNSATFSKMAPSSQQELFSNRWLAVLQLRPHQSFIRVAHKYSVLGLACTTATRGEDLHGNR